MKFFVVGVCKKDLLPLAERCVRNAYQRKRRTMPTYHLTDEQFEAEVHKKHEEMWLRKRKPKPISAPFGSPHPCLDYIAVAQRSGEYKDLHIATRNELSRKFETYVIR